MTEQQSISVARIQELGGMARVEWALAEIAKLSVVVVGEPIVDVYKFCRPEGISSKSPSLSARFVRAESYRGGSMAIKNHLDGFAKVVPCTVYGGVVKTRYLSEDTQQRIFEVTEIDEGCWDHPLTAKLIQNNGPAADVVIAADFGHGLFNAEVMASLGRLSTFIGLNVQTNSSNFGFNPYHRHKRYDYLSIDLREARIAHHDRFAAADGLLNTIEAKRCSMTLGPAGAMYRQGSAVYAAPAFSNGIVDTTGAGDAYFALTALLVRVGIEPEFVPFLGNVFAGLKTKIIGNKSPVSKASFIAAVSGLLR